jgi:hypothetical protein
VEDLAIEFYKETEDPRNSPNLESEDGDDMSFLMDCLDDAKAQCDPDMAIALLRVLKVLSRKEVNREAVEGHEIKLLLGFLTRTDSLSVPGEACSVLLNLCYSKDNVLAVIDHGGVPLLIQLLDSNSEVSHPSAHDRVSSCEQHRQTAHRVQGACIAGCSDQRHWCDPEPVVSGGGAYRAARGRPSSTPFATGRSCKRQGARPAPFVTSLVLQANTPADGTPTIVTHA